MLARCGSPGKLGLSTMVSVPPPPGDHEGPPFPTQPPSPLRMLMSFFLGDAFWVPLVITLSITSVILSNAKDLAHWAEMLRGVYTERSECAQHDMPSPDTVRF